METIKSKKFIKALTIVCCLLLLFSLNSNNTLAWLQVGDETVINTFSKSQVGCEVLQEYTPAMNQVKNVRIKNTGDIPAYIRVRLIVYRQNTKGQILGGNEQLPNFTTTVNWVEHVNGYYYNTVPVDPGSETTNLLSKINLLVYEDDESQVLEVLAEAIQSFPQNAVNDAWGVNILTLSQ